MVACARGEACGAHHHVEGAIRQLRDQDPFAHDPGSDRAHRAGCATPRERCSPSSTSRAASGCSACRSRTSNPPARCNRCSRSTRARDGQRHVQATRVQTTWRTARAPCNASRSNVPATPCAPASATTRCDRPSSLGPRSTTRDHDPDRARRCGHIGTVHSYALKQLVDGRPRRRGGDGDVRHRRRPLPSVPRHTTARPRCRRSKRSSTRSTPSGCARGPRRTSRRSSAAAARPRRSSARSRSHRPRGVRTGRGGPRNACRTRSDWCCVTRRCSRSRPSIVASGRHGRPLATTLRDDQYFPIQGQYGSTWRKDVAAAGGGTLIEHSIHDVDVLALVARRSRHGRCPHRQPVRARGHRRHRRGHDRLRRRVGRPADERVAPGADPRVEPAARGVLRGRPAVDRGRLPRSTPRADRRWHRHHRVRSARVGRPAHGARAVRQGRRRLRRAQPRQFLERTRVRRSRSGRPPVGRDRPRRPPARGRRVRVGGAAAGPPSRSRSPPEGPPDP